MGLFDGTVKKLGDKLVDGLRAKSTEYFAKAETEKENAGLAMICKVKGSILDDIALIIQKSVED